MNIINKICNKIRKIYYRSSGERYISFLRKKGVQVGEGTIVFNSKDIQIDYSRPELLKIGSNVFLHKGTTILTHDWASFCFVNLKSASNLNGNLNCSKELEHYAS